MKSCFLFVCLFLRAQGAFCHLPLPVTFLGINGFFVLSPPPSPGSHLQQRGCPSSLIYPHPSSEVTPGPSRPSSSQDPLTLGVLIGGAVVDRGWALK